MRKKKISWAQWLRPRINARHYDYDWVKKYTVIWVRQVWMKEKKYP
jgi:hypothetical protein